MMRTCLTLFVTIVFLIACSASDNLPGGLTLEEHPLSKAPIIDPFSFQPIDSTQEEILSRNFEERTKVQKMDYTFIDGNPAIVRSADGGDLTAAVFASSGEPPELEIRVFTSGDVIFKTSAGMPSPVMPLQGLWTYDGHWAMEILYAAPEIRIGQVFIDGNMVNQEKGYDEAFGFQSLSGKPFYFFQRDGEIGISYDGKEANLGYGSIPHYRCCSESVLNPTPAENMVAFFAQRGDDWYYVELGVFQ